MFWNEQKRINTILKQNNEELEKALEIEREKNRMAGHNIEILLENAVESRRKIKDLENNVEFLVNNLSEESKKLLK